MKGESDVREPTITANAGMSATETGDFAYSSVSAYVGSDCYTYAIPDDLIYSCTGGGSDRAVGDPQESGSGND